MVKFYILDTSCKCCAQFCALDFERLKMTMANPMLVNFRNIYRASEITGHGFVSESVGQPMLIAYQTVNQMLSTCDNIALAPPFLQLSALPTEAATLHAARIYRRCCYLPGGRLWNGSTTARSIGAKWR